MAVGEGMMELETLSAEELAEIHEVQRQWEAWNADKARWTDWRPIDTAPKNQIVWLGRPGSIRLGYWSKGKQWECHGSKDGGWRDHSMTEFGGMSSLNFAPTHWMPVPMPPE